MDLLNRAYSQLYQRYRAMTPGARMAAGLLLAAALAGLGYLLTRQASAPDAELMPGVSVSASQLPAMLSALAAANLKGYEVRGTKIYVPRGQEAECLAALATAKALPPALGTAQREAANSGSLWDVGSQRDRQRWLIAKQDELQKGICKMPGIESASVLFDEFKPGGFKEKVTTVVVLVKPTGAGQLDEATVMAIRKMMPGAFAGLKLENVTVADLNGRTWYGNPDDTGGGDNLYISLKRACEQDLKAKILNALGFVPNVTVEVSMELDRQRVVRTKQVKRAFEVPGDRQESSDDRRPRAGDGQAGRVSASGQRPNTALVLQALFGPARGDEEGAEPAGLVGSREQVEKESLGHAPISARVAVGVPQSYFKKIWQEKNPAEPGSPPKAPPPTDLDQIRAEVSAEIQRHVAPLLPPTEGVANAAALVTVTPFQDLPAPESPTPSFGQTALTWAGESWGTLSMIGLALVGLLVLRSMVRAAPAAPLPTVPVNRATDDDAGADDQGPAADSHRRQFGAAGLSPREELSALVEDDLETAVNVLRSWIGQGV